MKEKRYWGCAKDFDFCLVRPDDSKRVILCNTEDGYDWENAEDFNDFEALPPQIREMFAYWANELAPEQFTRLHVSIY